MINEYSNWVKYCITEKLKLRNPKTAMDLACGLGRNSIFLSEEGYKVISVDLDFISLKSFHKQNILKIQSDLENFSDWPFAKKVFDVIVVVNFLDRKVFKNIEISLKKNGYLIYETFGIGQEKLGKPKNKKFLLKKNELLKLTKSFQLICYEEVKVLSGNNRFIKNRILCKNVR